MNAQDTGSEQPKGDEEALAAVIEAAASDLDAALGLARSYLEKNPESAEMHIAVARLLSHEGGDSEAAAVHYKEALSIDGDMRDPELEEWFENAAGIRLELTSSHGVSLKAGMVDAGPLDMEEVRPIEVDHIASLKARRKKGGK